MSDKWIIISIIAGIVLLGTTGLFLNGDLPFKINHQVKYKNENIISSNAKESRKLEVKISNEEKGILQVSISKSVDDEKDEIEFEIKYDEEGNILNKDEIENLTDDENYKVEINKVVLKCTNEKLYLYDHISQSYSSYYSKR